MAKRFSPQFVLPTINVMEQVDSHSYDAQTDTHHTQLPVQERSHARLLEAITSSSNTGLEGGTLAQVPVVPFTFLSGGTALCISLLLSGLALFLIGADITLLTGRSVLYSGTRQVLFGLAAAGITFGVGLWLSVSLSG